MTYGRNLGGVVVVQRAVKPGEPPPAKGEGSFGGLNLPTVSINGATGHELDTALGTVIQFRRAGIEYVVLGSVPPAAAEAAARGL